MTPTLHHRPMMTQQLELSVLTAPVAAIDRRALSQAWYSALHLAHQGRTEQAQPLRLQICRPATSAYAPAAHERVRPSASERFARQHPGREQSPVRREDAVSDRRALRSPLARKIEAAFLHPSRRIARATFTIDGSAAKVHVAMQSMNGKLRLVAVCPPRVREAVARALEEARYALAARGISIDAQVGE